MPRPAGVRNQDYEEKRRALLSALISFIQSEGVLAPSMRQFAIAAGVSDVCLKHYFDDRRGLVVALLEEMNKNTAKLREEMRQPARSISEAVAAYVHLADKVSQNKPFMRWQVFALREATADPVIYEAYEKYLLRPASEALGESLMRSSGGRLGYEATLQAASHITFNAMFLAMQGLFGRDEGEDRKFLERMTRFADWLVHGLETPESGRRPGADPRQAES